MAVEHNDDDDSPKAKNTIKKRSLNMKIDRIRMKRAQSFRNLSSSSKTDMYATLSQKLRKTRENNKFLAHTLEQQRQQNLLWRQESVKVQAELQETKQRLLHFDTVEFKEAVKTQSVKQIHQFVKPIKEAAGEAMQLIPLMIEKITKLNHLASKISETTESQNSVNEPASSQIFPAPRIVSGRSPRTHHVRPMIAGHTLNKLTVPVINLRLEELRMNNIADRAANFDNDLSLIEEQQSVLAEDSVFLPDDVQQPLNNSTISNESEDSDVIEVDDDSTPLEQSNQTINVSVLVPPTEATPCNETANITPNTPISTTPNSSTKRTRRKKISRSEIFADISTPVSPVLTSRLGPDPLEGCSWMNNRDSSFREQSQNNSEKLDKRKKSFKNGTVKNLGRRSTNSENNVEDVTPEVNNIINNECIPDTRSYDIDQSIVDSPSTQLRRLVDLEEKRGRRSKKSKSKRKQSSTASDINVNKDKENVSASNAEECVPIYSNEVECATTTTIKPSIRSITDKDMTLIDEANMDLTCAIGSHFYNERSHNKQDIGDLCFKTVDNTIKKMTKIVESKDSCEKENISPNVEMKELTVVLQDCLKTPKFDKMISPVRSPLPVLEDSYNKISITPMELSVNLVDCSKSNSLSFEDQMLINSTNPKISEENKEQEDQCLKTVGRKKSTSKNTKRKNINQVTDNDIHQPKKRKGRPRKEKVSLVISSTNAIIEHNRFTTNDPNDCQETNVVDFVGFPNSNNENSELQSERSDSPNLPDLLNGSSSIDTHELQVDKEVDNVTENTKRRRTDKQMTNEETNACTTENGTEVSEPIDQCIILNDEEDNTSEADHEELQCAPRKRRTATKIDSYREPSVIRKLRQGGPEAFIIYNNADPQVKKAAAKTQRKSTAKRVSSQGRESLN